MEIAMIYSELTLLPAYTELLQLFQNKNFERVIKDCLELFLISLDNKSGIIKRKLKRQPVWNTWIYVLLAV